MMDNDSLLFSECLLTSSDVQFEHHGSAHHDYNRLGWADQEADREVAILFKDSSQIQTQPLNTIDQKKGHKKQKQKLCTSAPILNFPKLTAAPPVYDNTSKKPNSEETTTTTPPPPVLYQCAQCEFLCSEKHFITAHMQIEHHHHLHHHHEQRGLYLEEDYFDKRRIQASIIREKESRIAQIIVMVKKALGQAIDRTREETEVVLEETENAELEELVNVADSILEQQTETEIHPHNCQCGVCLDGSVDYLIGAPSTRIHHLHHNQSQKGENTLQKLFLTAVNIESIDGPGTSKRRKKAQPRKLQITSEESNGELKEPDSKGVIFTPDFHAREFDVRKMIECTMCKPGVMFLKREEIARHMAEFHPFTLESELPKETLQTDDSSCSLICQLCEEKFADRSKFNEHIEHIHMVWIPPIETGTGAQLDEEHRNNVDPFPIIPFTSMLTAHESNELEPWRKKFAKDCNKAKTTKSRSHKCPLCVASETMMTTSEFKSHMIREHRYKRGFRCASCKTSFKQLDDFVEHAKTHSHLPFQCEVCHESFRSKKQLTLHRNSVDHKETVKKTSNKLVVDGETGNSEKQVKCPSCDFKCATMSELRTHMRVETHHHPCEHCSKTFRSKLKLHNHVATEHGGANGTTGAFLCDQCGKPFRLYATLLRHKRRNHLKSHHKVCDYCNATFPDNYKLQRHIRSKHSSEKPYKCQKCPKSFARKDKLNDHMWSHTDEKLFYCHECKKEFSRPDALKAHQRYHFAPFKFTCKTCDKKFQVQADFANHVKKGDCGLPTLTQQPQQQHDQLKFKDSKRKPRKPNKTTLLLDDDDEVDLAAVDLNLNEPLFQQPSQQEHQQQAQANGGREDEEVDTRITELQPVQVSVNNSGSVHSISKREFQRAISYSPTATVLEPALEMPALEMPVLEMPVDEMLVPEDYAIGSIAGQLLVPTSSSSQPSNECSYILLQQNRPSLVPLEDYSRKITYEKNRRK